MANNKNNKKGKGKKTKVVRINLSWLYILLLLGIGWMLFGNSSPSAQKIEWAQVKEMILDGDVKEIHFVRNDFKGNVTIKPDCLAKYDNLFVGGKVPSRSPHFFFLTSTRFDPETSFEELNALLPEDGQVKVVMENDAKIWSNVLEWVLPLLLLFLLWGWMFRGMNKGAGGGAGGGMNPFNVGKATGKLADKDKVNVTFKDVAGLYGAKGGDGDRRFPQESEEIHFSWWENP